MDLVCKRSFGVGLRDGTIDTLISRGVRLPVHRQSTRPALDYSYQPAAGNSDHTAFRIPIWQGRGRHAASLGTLEVISPLPDPRSCRVVLFCRVILRLGRTGWLRATVKIGSQTQTVRLCVEISSPRRRRKLSWIQVGPIVPDADQSAPNVRPFMRPH